MVRDKLENYAHALVESSAHESSARDRAHLRGSRCDIPVEPIGREALTLPSSLKAMLNMHNTLPQTARKSRNDLPSK